MVFTPFFFFFFFDKLQILFKRKVQRDNLKVDDSREIIFIQTKGLTSSKR